MKTRKLPLERELETIVNDPKQGRARMVHLRQSLFLETAQTRGFQLVTALLRDLDARAFAALRSGLAKNPERVLGRLECIEEIRRSLVSLLPEDHAAKVDWHDEETEEFVLLDRDQTTE